MSIYTNKHVLVADSLEELHTFAESIGVFKNFFVDHRRHPFYKLPPAKLQEAYQMGAKIKSNTFVQDKSREMKKIQMEWYKTATDEQIEFKVGSWKQYVAETSYIFEGMLVKGDLLTDLTIQMFKNLRDEKDFDAVQFIMDARAKETEKEAQTVADAITEGIGAPIINP